MNIEGKYERLRQILKGLGRVVVAYSGGVDSTFLLKAAVETLGSGNVLACIGVSPSLPRRQRAGAMEMARSMGVRIREVEVHEMDDPAYVANRPDRCFHCKTQLYRLLSEIAREGGFKYVICGSNLDDESDFRPGAKAATVFGVSSPLAEARLSKSEIRSLSQKLGLATAQMPASPCLASRISYGLEITERRLGQVEEGEAFLRELGFMECRVRHHGNIARVEVAPAEIPKISSEPVRCRVVRKLKSAGFKFVTIDLQGFRSGSLNEPLSEQDKEVS